MTPRRWLPTTTASKLAFADTILAGIVPAITDTRARILDLVPGHSGKPAGTGDPPGGHGGATTSVVERLTERTTSTDDDQIHRTCCVDDELALCGEVMPDGEWEFEDDEDCNCGACLIADAVDACPLGGQCRLEDDA